MSLTNREAMLREQRANLQAKLRYLATYPDPDTLTEGAKDREILKMCDELDKLDADIAAAAE